MCRVPVNSLFLQTVNTIYAVLNHSLFTKAALSTLCTFEVPHSYFILFFERIHYYKPQKLNSVNSILVSISTKQIGSFEKSKTCYFPSHSRCALFDSTRALAMRRSILARLGMATLTTWPCKTLPTPKTQPL